MTNFVLVLSALICVLTTAQTVGSYRARAAGLSMLVIVNEDNYIDLVYSCINPSTEATGATQYIAGSYPLRPGSGSKFSIDYNARTVFPRLTRGGSLYDQIKKDCPDSQVADGDLTTITFTTRDTVIMELGKKMVNLSRTDGDAVNIYRQFDSNGSYKIEYLVTTTSFLAADSYYGSFKKLEITVTCIRALSPVLLTATVSEFFTSFEFTQVKGHAEFQISSLPDLNALVGFKNEVNSVCAPMSHLASLRSRCGCWLQHCHSRLIVEVQKLNLHGKWYSAGPSLVGGIYSLIGLEWMPLGP